MFNKPWRHVAEKELKDSLRDRNAVLTVLLFPLLGPVMVFFMLNQGIKIATDVQDIDLSISGYTYAHDLIDHLQQNGIEVAPFPGEETQLEIETNNASTPDVIAQTRIDSVKSAIDNREYDYVLLVPKDFEQRISRSLTVNLELHYDSSRNQSVAKVARIEQLINAWARELTSLRLIARGISPQVIEPVNLVRIDVAADQARALRILSMIPMFTLMAAFVCGIGVAVDATAGERERKSLEPLLVNPISRMQLVLGKWLVATLFSMTGVILVTVLNLVVLNKVPLEQIGLVVNLGVTEITGIWLTLLPMAFLVTAMQMFVGMMARSFKEAQGYIGMMNLLPMFPYFMSIFNNQGRELWMSFVPVYGQHMLLQDVVSGKTPQAWEFTLSALVIGCVTIAFLFATARLFKRERIIFT